MSDIRSWARHCVTGLSSFGSSLLRSLAALRFNPSRFVGYAMIAAPFVAIYTLAFLMLTPFQAATVVVVPLLVVAWIGIAVRLLMR